MPFQSTTMRCRSAVVEQVDARRPGVRVGGHRGEHAGQPGEQQRGGAAVEQVGGELQAPGDAGGRAGVVAALGRADGQVELGDRVSIGSGDTVSAGQVQVGARRCSAAPA